MTHHSIKHTVLALTVSTALGLAGTQAAFADFTSEDVVNAITATYGAQGVDAEIGSQTLDGDDVILEDVQPNPNAPGMTVERIELRNVTETDDGGFVIGEVFIPAGDYDTPTGISLSMGDMSVENLRVSASSDAGLDNGSYTSMQLEGVEASESGDLIFSANRIEADTSPFDVSQPIVSEINIDEMLVEVENMQDAQQKQALLAMGYEQIEGDITATSTWTAQTGEISIDEFVLSAEDAADLSMTMTLGGYTEEIAQAFLEAQRQIQADPDNAQAAGFSMLGLVQQLEFQNMELQIKDESLTGRLLEHIGSTQGTNREGITAMAKGTLPIALSQLQAPEFAAQAQQAVSTYLDDPDTLTLTAQPENPVPFAVVMGAAFGGNPAALIEALNVQITANE